MWQNNNWEPYLDMLMAAAIRQCDNIEDARDLVQDTLLAALAYQKSGAVIDNLRGWLLTVLNRRCADMLRRKYRQPTVTIGEDFDIADDCRVFEQIGQTDEEEAVRREVAYLADKYRAIIVRHYFRGESVERIAADLHIPIGTVKSRLNFGRKQLKKGMENMDTYKENSYSPQRLFVSWSGSSGENDEPLSLVPYDDLLTQNLLILAYDKPITVSELAKAIGVPTAYVEPVVDKLVDGELMKRTDGGKVYTDFILYEPMDFRKYLREEETFAADYAPLYCEPMTDAIAQLRQTSFYSKRLERFLLIHMAMDIVQDSLRPYMPPMVYPERPHNGAWIAMGHVQKAQEENTYTGKEEYLMAGLRTTTVDDYLGAKNLILRNFETSLYPLPKYDGFGYNSLGELEMDILRLFYLIRKSISPETVGFSPKMLKNMPLMQERGMIAITDGVPVMLIPCLTHAQYAQYAAIKDAATAKAVEKLTEPMGAYIRDKKKALPPHLKSVPDQRRTSPYEPPVMCLVYEAIRRGVHERDLGYPCPEMLAVMD